MKFLALDFETSGLDHKRHAPVTLGIALMENGSVLESKEWLFGPPMTNGKIAREYDVCALEINGMSWKRIKGGDPIAVVMAELTQWLLDFEAHALPVVAFNAPFDLGWYSECLFLGGSWNQHLRRFETFKPPLVGPWHCARLMAVDSLNLDTYSLDAVLAHFGLSRSGDAHGALEDAILAGKVYHALTQMAVTA